MLIINADDWGRSQAETNAALKCYNSGRITSVSAMVYMQDSERAAQLAQENQIDVGLHLNFSEPFTGDLSSLKDSHRQIVAFLTQNKYAQLFYNPFLQRQFANSCQTQFEEFVRLFGKLPSHVDGHHHMHLCANLLLSKFIPPGMRIRRNFSFWPGEKSVFNRAYRRSVDCWLARRYRLLDYFFDLLQCIKEKKLNRVASLARANKVELMVHPIIGEETEYLMSDAFDAILKGIELGSFADLRVAAATA